MEQAYRRLKEELLKNPLVSKVDISYLYLTVTWKSGIKERLVIKRFLNSYKGYIHSRLIRPQFMPSAMWWEDLSNGYKPKPHYLDDVEYEDDIEQYSNLINWKWSDFKKAGFFERLITIHEILEYIIKNGWKEQKYPNSSLINSLQLVYNEKTKAFKMNNSIGYKLKSYRKLAERPAGKLLEHFMPYGFYGKDDPYYFMSAKTMKQRRRIYLAINNVIRRNKTLEKKGKKQFFDFNYRNILKMMRIQHKSIRVIPYSIRQINLYTTIIKDLGLDGQSFYDVDPALGELHIAAHATNCPYYYRESAPFDQGCKELSKFLKSHCEKDSDNMTYDFGIYDGNFLPNYDKTEHAFELLTKKTNIAILYVANKYFDKWVSEHKKHDDQYEMKVSRSYLMSGKLLIYYC